MHSGTGLIQRRSALEWILGIYALFLAVENTLLVLSQRNDLLGSSPLLKAAVKALAALAGWAWPWSLAIMVALMAVALLLTPRSREDAREVRHA